MKSHPGLMIAVCVTAFAVGTGVTLHYADSPAKGASEARQLPPFRSVELAGGNVVTIRTGKAQSVVIHADRDLLDRVTTEVRNGRLVIGSKPGSTNSRSPMSVAIGMPALDAVSVSGSGDVSASGLRGRRLTVTLPGSGVVRASGTVGELDVTVGGSGDAHLLQLSARDVRATIGGSGVILVSPTHSLRASIPGSGSIIYFGEPEHVSTSVTGSGVVVHGAT